MRLKGRIAKRVKVTGDKRSRIQTLQKKPLCVIYHAWESWPLGPITTYIIPVMQYIVDLTISFCFQKFYDNAQHVLPLHLKKIPPPTHNLNFHCRWRWLHWIQATFKNLFYFNKSDLFSIRSKDQVEVHCEVP